MVSTAHFRFLQCRGDIIGVIIEIRRARSDRNAAKFYGYPYFTFEIFCAHKNGPKGFPIAMDKGLTKLILHVFLLLFLL